MTGNAVCQGGKGAAQARRGGQNSELIIHVPRRAASAPGTSAPEVTMATAAMATSEEKRAMVVGHTSRTEPNANDAIAAPRMTILPHEGVIHLQ